MIGQTVQHYRVIDRLGEGGMGVVWRAEDLRLGRQVALKLVGGDLSDDPEAIARFEAEARVASSINHPHIVSVYDVGSVGGSRFIAMELVDGDNLQAILASRRVRSDEAIEWALQIGDALAAAHRAGVVHRDVKPANIYISRAGFAKLGDFGIAKLREQAADPSATQTSGATARGVLGSPHYLSPEQARGEPLDVRTDVFSFAATLYEILTGRRAFPGASAAEVVSSVLREDPPPVSQLRSDVPPALEQIVEKGLEKRREYRYQHMDDVVADLRRLKRDLETRKGDPRAAAVVPAFSRGARIPMAALAAAFLAGGVAAFAAVRWLLPAPGAGQFARPSYELTRITSEPDLEAAPSWSPDGRSIAFTSNAGGHLGIWIRQVPGERSIRVSMRGVDEAQPAWSPDGNRIAFVSARNRSGRFGIFLGSRPIEIYVAGQEGDLFVMPALGGTARRLAEDAYDPAWAPDGARLAFRSIRDGAWRLYTVALESGLPRQLTQGDADDAHPDVSRDGRRLLFLRHHREIYVMPADGRGGPERVFGSREHNRLVEWPAWGPRDATIVFSVADMTGDLFLLQPHR